MNDEVFIYGEDDAVTCPWCGCRADVNDDDDWARCDRCEKDFRWTVESENDYLTEPMLFKDAPATAEFLLDGEWHVKADPEILDDDDDPKWNAMMLDSKKVWVDQDSEVLISEAMKETSRESFIEDYCKRSEVTREWLDVNFVALPCNCGESNCNGWAMVGNNPESIKMHNELYGETTS